MTTDTHQITGLLRAWGRGESGAIDRLTPLIYAELHRLAGRYMRRERPAQTLQATALVNEAFMRLVDARTVDWQDRAHFFAVAARVMRRILVDAARSRASWKRGGRAEHVDHSTGVDLDRLPATPAAVRAQLCALDDALTTLAQMDPRRAQVVELRYFGGLTVEETAHVLKISPQSVMRDWKLARAWLARELSR
jgi:RNA polymerase sigma factor (TIGR02999 family)